MMSFLRFFINIFNIILQPTSVPLWRILSEDPRCARIGVLAVSSRSARLPVIPVCDSRSRCPNSTPAVPRASGDPRGNPLCHWSTHPAHRRSQPSVFSASRCSSPRTCFATRLVRQCSVRRSPTRLMVSTGTGTSALMPSKEPGLFWICLFR